MISIIFIITSRESYKFFSSSSLVASLFKAISRFESIQTGMQRLLRSSMGMLLYHRVRNHFSFSPIEEVVSIILFWAGFATI